MRLPFVFIYITIFEGEQITLNLKPAKLTHGWDSEKNNSKRSRVSQAKIQVIMSKLCHDSVHVKYFVFCALSLGLSGRFPQKMLCGLSISAASHCHF